MRNVDLINSNVDSSLRKFSLPLMISFLIHMLYAWVDLYFVSKLGPEAIAAVGVGEQLLFFAFGIGMGFGVGTGIIIARRIGENNYPGAGNTATQGLAFMILFAVLISITLYFLMPFVLDLMQIKGTVRNMSIEYLSVILIGLPFNFIIFQINSMIRSTGNSVIPMVILITANVINAVLSPLFIFGIGFFPEWGVAGAAVATAIAQITGSILALTVLTVYFKKIHISFNRFSFDFFILKKIFRLGIPASLQLIAVSLNRMVLTWLTNSFGTAVLTTYMIGMRVDLFVFMSIFAVGAAIEIITGQNLGAKKIERIFEYYKSAIKQLSFLIIFFGIVIFLSGEYIALVFTKNTEIIMNVKEYLRINVFAYIFFAIGIISVRVISGAGDYIRSLILVVIVLYLFQLPIAYLLSKTAFFDYQGIWYGILASHVFFSIIGISSLYNRKWIKVKL
jgi:putative MATE family efflux protein